MLLRLSSFAFLATGLIVLGLWIADLCYPLSLPKQQQDFATVVLDQQGYPLRAFADKEGVWRYKVSLEEVSPYYLEALLAYEDRYFYAHPGVNPVSLLRASWQYIQYGRIVSGGSTLTMQVARLFYPHPRTVSGKLQQIFRALQLEWHLSKQQILTLYLNYAPFGGTLEGVQAASYQYLRKPVSQLRRSEATLLAVLPQAPSRFRPDRYPKRAQQARDKVIKRLVEHGYWSSNLGKQVKQEPVAVWTAKQPFVAPLLARRLHQQLPKQAIINTYIQRDLQQRIETYIENYARLQGDGVSAAVLVVENSSNKVISYVGSADIGDQDRAGHVDMIRAIRSPGSTLKPILYGLAIDDDIIHSSSLLADVPRVNSHYRPGNFANGFAGPISASDALQRSLNIPFVQLIEAYGEQAFVNKLEHVLQPLQIPGGRANPAVILGGVGVSLERLVNLYGSFAKQGMVSELSLSPQLSSTTPRRLLSPEAAWITWKTLTGVTVPERYRWGESSGKRPIIGWKTGTSWGNRDTWSIGSTPQHTIGVWVGRPSGKPLQGALGVTTAAPVLFSVLSMLEDKPEPLSRPFGVEDKVICWPDGRAKQLVLDGCDRQLFALTKNGSTPRTLQVESGMAFHQAQQSILVNQVNALRVNAQCNVESNFKRQIVTFWPHQLEPWLPLSERRVSRLPTFDPECLVIDQQSDTLTIIGIEPNQQLYAVADNPILLSLQATGAVGKVSWYLNGERVAENAKPVQIQLSGALSGDAELVAIDENGVIGRVAFSVSDYDITSD